MAKFLATKLGDLLTVSAKAGRAVRSATYADMGVPFVAVVHAEADDGSWFELDAESVEHAKTLANNAVEVLGARGASCRMVGDNGTVSLKAFYLIYADYSDDMDCGGLSR